MQDSKRGKLSKSVLEMKFMKKTKERVDKEEEDAEGQDMYANEITEDMKRSGNTLFLETSIFQCKDLLEGRLSYGGMNEDIEKYMHNSLSKTLQDIQEKEKEVTDIDMAKGYSTLNTTISNKFKSRNKNGSHQNKKKKFNHN